jgi:trans-aconitate 2-methyltransferase
MATDAWNPTQYDKFRREREQPFFDLLAIVEPAPGMRVVDLGCGTGKLTRLLHARLQARETVGIDRSARMLESAQAEEPIDRPAGLRFQVGTIEAFTGRDEYDLILSNAAFHWVEDHDALITRLAAAIRPGGQLAFQVPAMHDATSHTIAEDLTAVEPFRTAFDGWRRPQPVLTPAAYARLLYRTGFTDQTVRLAVYPHLLESAGHMVEWMKGTLLTEYERRLTPELFVQFVSEYRARLLATLDDARPFFFPFNRILCWARKSA